MSLRKIASSGVASIAAGIGSYQPPKCFISSCLRPSGGSGAPSGLTIDPNQYMSSPFGCSPKPPPGPTAWWGYASVTRSSWNLGIARQTV